jgi:hypothetical protein
MSFCEYDKQSFIRSIFEFFLYYHQKAKKYLAPAEKGKYCVAHFPWLWLRMGHRFSNKMCYFI